MSAPIQSTGSLNTDISLKKVREKINQCAFIFVNLGFAPFPATSYAKQYVIRTHHSNYRLDKKHYKN